MGRKVTEIVEELAIPLLAESGLELVDIEFKKEGKNRFLRLFIDRIEGRVSLEDISCVSERLSKELDRVDPISGAYILEVSSPGAERPLKKEKDFARAIGKHVHIKTYEPIDGKKIFEGTLTDFKPERLVVEVEGKEVVIPYPLVAKARLAILF